VKATPLAGPAIDAMQGGAQDRSATSQWSACCAVYATRTGARQRLVREHARRAMRELRIMPAHMCDIRRISKWKLKRQIQIVKLNNCFFI
jgi:hypothetical protein